MKSLNTRVRAMTGIDVLEELYHADHKISDSFDHLLCTSLSIAMVEYALFETVSSSGLQPDYVLGTSLGEYIALTSAGVFDADTLFMTVYRLSKSIQESCSEGGMIAVMHRYKLFYESAVLNQKAELAARNCPQNFVVSANTDCLRDIEKYFDGESILYQRLNVKYAFHSSQIESARANFISYIQPVKCKCPEIPCYSVVNHDRLNSINPAYLWDIIRKPIEFQKTVQKLESMESAIYVDLGPAGSLANFVRYNINHSSESEVYSIITPFAKSKSTLEQLLAKHGRKYAYQERCRCKPQLNQCQGDRQMIAWVFPGQGAQYKGMGADLLDMFSGHVGEAETILGYSLRDLCLRDPYKLLNRTKFTQPAVYVINALASYRKIDETGRKPDFLAGHSLGEYNALLTAGVYDFETGLYLVKKRAELMDRISKGTMAAVIGLNAEQIARIIEDHELSGIHIANFNSPIQTVIAGLRDEMDSARQIFIEAGAQHYIPLNVNGAFHTPLLNEAKLEFEAYIEQLTLKEPDIPVISNRYAKPYEASTLKLTLVEQMTHPVRWTDTIRYLFNRGEMEFEEIGPKRVLSSFISDIRQEVTLIRKKAVKRDNPKNSTEQIITPESLGNAEFRKDHNLRFAYAAGSMYRGIASEELVIKMGLAGMIGFFGAGGLSLARIEDAINNIQTKLDRGRVFGINLLYNIDDPELEEAIVDRLLKYKVKRVEASSYIDITPALVKYRLKGLKLSPNGIIIADNKIIAKISRPETAELFLRPAPQKIVNYLSESGGITDEEAALANRVPLADALCAEADSAGHTDHGVSFALIPTIIRLRDRLMEKHQYFKRVNVGAAGGIGTPEAAAAAFILGADFILTGSINQCTVEAGISELAKNLLQQMNIQDTAYAPAGDLFEWGAKVQVLKKGLFFPARAQKLYDLYRRYESLDAIDLPTRKKIEQTYFKRSLETVYQDVKQHYPRHVTDRAEKNQKYKMALVFKWYFGKSSQVAINGNIDCKIDYQIHCSPALGAFNQWVKGTPMEDWRNRHVDEIAHKLMNETSKLLNNQFLKMQENSRISDQTSVQSIKS